MDKKILSIAILAAIGLSACGKNDSHSEQPGNADPAVPLARIAFDPGAATPVIPVPNDIVKAKTTDGTLNLGLSTTAQADPYDPQAVLSSLDGWSVSTPFSIGVTLPTGVTLNAASVEQPGAVVLLQVTAGGSTDCADASPIDACQLVTALSYGTDFITKASGSNIAIIPLKPLKAKTSYLVATTSLVTDSDGRSVAGSATYNLLKQDLATSPLGSDDQKLLQGAVNSYEGVLAAAGVDKDSVTYSALFTTQSTLDVASYTKLALLGALNGGNLALSSLTDTGMTAADILLAKGLVQPGSQAAILASAAKVYKTTLKLPYFLDKPTAADFASGDCDISTGDLTKCAKLSSRWVANGDSPAAVLLALKNGTLSQANFITQATAQSIDPAAAMENPTLLVGAHFTNDAGDDIDPNQFLTQYNPVPMARSVKTIDVLVTIPDAATVNTIRGNLGMSTDVAVGPAGWPTVIYGHGITSYKETGLAAAGTLALNGQAMIAIDLPLHGTRGVDYTGDGIEDVNAGDNVGIYTNLASLGTVRDNLRESVADDLSLRLALSAQTAPGGMLDGTNVSFVGISLGSIVGAQAVAMGNTDTKDPRTNADYSSLFQFKRAVLSVPGAGVAGIFAFSPAFGPTVEAGLKASATFQATLAAANTSNLQPGDAGYDQLVATVYAGFMQQFLFAAQTTVDSADPIAYGATLAANTPGLLVHEVVGGGTADNPGDQVIPNSNATHGLPLSGTEPLIATMGLSPITASVMTPDGTTEVSGVARFNAGAHTSLLNPAPEGLDPVSSAAVTTEMQSEVASFLASKGLTILVQDSSVLIGAN
ncbi:lipase [Gallaecimonas kandeliae]|uniref:VolA/Pla-1 family phospholipase n=1 Tax=Gallaecimonas kandeliae TaxID=3029055 RepID=UPI0026494815|nr:VolA/Pla-1 family phospholipase [Gallaecimonas kandeliae]WKE67082.1 lipase [Gallaecimonas kandeliae]